MGKRGGIWLIAAAAAIPGLVLSCTWAMLGQDPAAPAQLTSEVEQAPTPATTGAIVPAGSMPGSPVPGVVFTLPPLTLAGLMAALVSGLMAAGTARVMMRSAVSDRSAGNSGGNSGGKGRDVRRAPPPKSPEAPANGSDDAGSKRVSDERLRDMAEALPQIVWITDASGVIEYYNRRWFEYSGVAPDDPDPMHWRRFIHPDDTERLLSSWRAAAALGQSWQAEYRLRRADGVHRWHLGQAVPVTDDNGRIIRWFGSATDIDGQKCVEAELSRTAAERARLLQQKEMLLLEIQHRVRNNLQLISSLLSLQNRTITDPETLQQFIEARGRIQTVAQVHEQLYLTDQPDLMDFAGLLRGMCLNQCKPDIEVVCRCQGPLDLPIDEATPLALIANELISNAVEYAYPADRGLLIGGGEVRVILEGQSPGSVELRVEDDGIGLPPDQERAQGSLGMRLVQELTRQLRGDIETASGIGGTSIVIRFVSHPVPQLDLYNGHRGDGGHCGDGHQAVTIPGKSPQRSA
jgi:PAS domain S-box-containing protein